MCQMNAKKSVFEYFYIKIPVFSIPVKRTVITKIVMTHSASRDIYKR